VREGGPPGKPHRPEGAQSLKNYTTKKTQMTLIAPSPKQETPGSRSCGQEPVLSNIGTEGLPSTRNKKGNRDQKKSKEGCSQEVKIGKKLRRGRPDYSLSQEKDKKKF